MPVAAIDQGTTSTRALVLDDAGRGEVVRALEHRQFYPQPGFVEHDPEELLAHIRRCIEACHNVSVSAIGFANQGESCLAWDADSKQAVSPVIVWQDNRTHRTIEKLRADGAQRLVTERAGVPLNAYFSASKLAWIVAQIPAAAALHRRGKLRLGTTDAFFLDRLTGRFVTDLTTASRTSLLNLKSGCWDSDLCDLFGVPINALPRIVASTGAGEFGEIESNGKPIPVTASLVDQQAALYGHGCRAPGDAKFTFGTGAFALALAGDQAVRPPTQTVLPTVAWQRAFDAPMYALEGGVYCAGAAVNWAKSLGLFESFEQINRFSSPPAIARDLVFVPALSGLGCPHWEHHASGLWLGLSLDTQPFDLMQSVLEGIAFRAAEVMRAAGDVLPLNDTLSIDGGVSANPYFCQFLADALGKQLIARDACELTAYGAALLAGGVAQPFADAFETRYEPREDMTHYAERFQQAIERSRHWLR